MLGVHRQRRTVLGRQGVYAVPGRSGPGQHGSHGADGASGSEVLPNLRVQPRLPRSSGGGGGSLPQLQLHLHSLVNSS